MTKRGFEYLKKWISENVSSRPPANEDNGQLIAALQRLRDDAEKAGIGWLEMADDSEDIKDAILEAMK